MNARVLLLDNYDSFTFNLAQALRTLGARVLVHRNDALDVDQALALRPTHVLVSPGPGRPEDAGISIPLIRTVLGRIPVLGVCLGHQALAVALGGVVKAARQLVHGEASPVHHDGAHLFRALPNPFPAGRYHSLAVDAAVVPRALQVVATTTDGEVMALRHRHAQAYGVQFHPESVLTPDGVALLANFLRGAR